MRLDEGLLHYHHGRMSVKLRRWDWTEFAGEMLVLWLVAGLGIFSLLGVAALTGQFSSVSYFVYLLCYICTWFPLNWFAKWVVAQDTAQRSKEYDRFHHLLSSSAIDRFNPTEVEEEQLMKMYGRSEKERLEEKAFLSSEKERKTAAFNNRIFQSGFRSPSMSKKELAWNDTGGKCKLCRSYSIAKELGFWWRIHPTLEVVLLCRNCAEKEELSVEHNEEVVKSRRISEEVRDSVWNRDGGKCVQCGSNENLEFDHIIPFSKGGANTKRNIQLLCESCNRAKSDTIG